MIVLYRLSTSNHNTGVNSLPVDVIVLYRLSTSNHNFARRRADIRQLSYIVFLHQTTTTACSFSASVLLSYIVFLHQTTTIAHT